MITFREAGPGDQPRLRAIHLAGTMSSYGGELPWLEPILADPATPLEGAEWTIVATDEHDVLGYVAVTARHIENFFIDPAAQGRRVGSALLAEVEARLRPRFDSMTLRCLHANPGARRFYDRHGFRVVETQTIVYHGRSLPAWFMEKRTG